MDVAEEEKQTTKSTSEEAKKTKREKEGGWGEEEKGRGCQERKGGRRARWITLALGGTGTYASRVTCRQLTDLRGLGTSMMDQVIL